MITEKDLLSLKEDIERAKAKVVALTTEKKLLLKQLKTDFDCEDIQAAEILLDKWEQDLENTEAKINKGIKDIEKKYPQL